jgi:predicted amidohydrolase
MSATDVVRQADQAARETPWRSDGILRIALVQIAPALGDVARNHRLHLERIRDARRSGADLIVFPELSLTGYFLRDMVPDVALTADSTELESLCNAAGDAALVVGFVEQGDRHRYFNSALLSSTGGIRSVHRKVYLPTYGLFEEARHFARGERIRSLDAGGLAPEVQRVGLLVCEDFWHLSTITVLQADGIDLLICVANSPARGVAGQTIATAETYERLCRMYAELLGVAVVFVNRVGFEDGLCFWGGSMVVGPDAAIVARAPMLDEALVVGELNLLEMKRQRLVTPLARDERLLLTIEELQRIRRHRYEG